MNKEHIKVGNTVWLKGINNARNIPVCEYPIVKVGRKYFYVKAFYQDLKFSLETFSENAGQYSSNYEVFRTKAEYYDEVERREIWVEFCNYFESCGCPKDIPLEKLREIKLLIS